MTDTPQRRRIVLGVTGSIAAYKSAEIARLLVTAGHEVRVVMSESAQEFITPLTLQSVTGNPVTTQFWNEQETGIGHIELADWAEVLLIAPASADTISKLRLGSAETPLLAVALATRAPVVIAPAMNMHMYEHAATQENLAVLRGRGLIEVAPEVGELACGWNGTGRLAQPSLIVHYVQRAITPQSLKNKNVVVTAGATKEPIDSVRFISNRSSGRMGVALALEAFYRGARVTLVHGSVQVAIPAVVEARAVTTALDMQRELSTLQANGAFDLLLMAAAVSDYRSSTVVSGKIKREKTTPEITLEQNPDIVASIAQQRGSGRKPLIVGFAVECGEYPQLIEEFRRKLHDKSLDILIGNRADEALEKETNRVWIVTADGREQEIATSHKSIVAQRIFDVIGEV